MTFFRFVTIQVFDGQTDGRTDRKALPISCVEICITYSRTVKTETTIAILRKKDNGKHRRLNNNIWNTR